MLFFCVRVCVRNDIRTIVWFILKCMDLIWFERILAFFPPSSPPIQFICILLDILLHARSQHQKLKQYSVSPKQCGCQHQHSVQKFINGHSFLSHKQWAREAKTNDRWMQNTIKMKTVRIGRIFDGYDIYRPRKKRAGGMDEVWSGAEFPFELSQNEILKSVRISALDGLSVCACVECMACSSTLAAGETRNRCDSKWNEIHLISSLRQRWQKYNRNSSATEACA